MRSLDLKHGDRLDVRNRQLRLTNLTFKETRLWSLSEFPFDTVSIPACGGSITFDAIRWLSSVGASILGLGFDGRPDWETMPSTPKTSPIRLAQYRAANDRGFRFALAKLIVVAKCGPVPSWVATVDALRGVEGQRAAEYWEARGIIRESPNATNAPNAQLNYSFSLLESRVRACIVRAGLDPAIGFLHVPQESKHALVYDVMEPFRADVTDAALSIRLTRPDTYERYGHGVRLRPHAARLISQRVEPAIRDDAILAFLGVLSAHFPTAEDLEPRGRIAKYRYPQEPSTVESWQDYFASNREGRPASP